MDAFVGYFFYILNPATVEHFFGVFPKFFALRNLPIGLLLIFGFTRFVLPTVVLWIVALIRPGLLFPPLGRPVIAENPLVSVVIAGRNAAPTIARTLQSVLYCGYGNIEIIFVDDASSDATLSVARAVARSVGAARSTGPSRPPRIRVVSSPYRNGKPSALNMGLALAAGEYTMILDADCELQVGVMRQWLQPFADRRVGAVAANVRVANPERSLVTRLQECEYAFTQSLARLVAARLNLLAIVSGAAGLFRTGALRALGGYDTGLGDDTDMTLRLRKCGWRIDFAPDAQVWVEMPRTWGHLTQQRFRWARNLVKIRLSKHRDMMALFHRYGFANGVIALNVLVFRVLIPFLTFALLAFVLATAPFDRPILIGQMYCLGLIWTVLKYLVARDLLRTPSPDRAVLLPLLPLYFIYMRLVSVAAIFVELTGIQSKHAYVPEHIWNETPHW
jgi:cellulose synthase/poly-beta-1,6-N-acetylglucosamine synthase-like glycosyltransferase